jgi:hypothetical protein
MSPTNSISFVPNLISMCLSFCQQQPKELDLHGGHEMVQQHHTLWNVSNKQHQYYPEFDVK